ncbi:MAG TPA: FkbM family methyltransferase [Polyangiaceae bacterium]
MSRYSQFGQDEFVIRMLGQHTNGFFLDSGASDGVSASNTYLLEKELGWTGICVEPNLALFDYLVRNRRAVCVNCCLYDREGDVEFLEAGTLGGVLSDYQPSLLELATRTYDIPRDLQGRLETVTKQARTVSSLLAEYNAPQVIDYWSLDTEGSELRILKSFPFARYRVRVISVEHNRYSIRHEIQSFLESQGYVLAAKFDIDDCYVEKAHRPLTHAMRRSRWTRRQT